jgi:hypothetical protein
MDEKDDKDWHTIISDRPIKVVAVTPHYLQIKMDFVKMCNDLKIQPLDDLI